LRLRLTRRGRFLFEAMSDTGELVNLLQCACGEQAWSVVMTEDATQENPKLRSLVCEECSQEIFMSQQQH